MNFLKNILFLNAKVRNSLSLSLILCLSIFFQSCQSSPKHSSRIQENAINTKQIEDILQAQGLSNKNSNKGENKSENLDSQRQDNSKTLNEEDKNAFTLNDENSNEPDSDNEFDSEDNLDLQHIDPQNDEASLDKMDSSYSSDSAPSLMCDDGLYYQAWVKQFDSTWTLQNHKKYKTKSAQFAALQKARTDAFIQLTYPALEKTGYDFPAVINSQVVSWIDYFIGKGRRHFVVWLRRGQELIPKMEAVLEENGLPKDLVYLSMIESGFSNRALSEVGAVGPWQFMPYTARRYGLKINDWIDERRDPVKATQAAAGYLTDLYTQFGSWHLAAGAYNCGEGCISKKLHKYGEDSSYFDLTSKGVINKQTADYVPKILAAMLIAKNPEKFGFETTKLNDVVTKTKVMKVHRSVSLPELARAIGIDSTILNDLNPEVRLGITPPSKVLGGETYNIVIPISKYNDALIAVDTLPEPAQSHIVQARIKRRETLQSFARRYHLDVKSILNANSGLKSTSALRRGQVVYVPVSLGTGQYEKLFSVKKAKKKKAVVKKSKVKKTKMKTKMKRTSHKK